MTLQTTPGRKMNRLAVPALIAALLAMPKLLVSSMLSLGFPYKWFQGEPGEMQTLFAITNLAHSLLACVFEVFTFLALVLGVAAYVQIRCRPEAERGKGVALAAIILAACGTFFAFLLWFFSAVAQVAQAHH